MQDRTIDAFWERVHKVELTGCWLWTGHIRRDNLYGTWSFSHEGKTVTKYVHIYAYELLIGPVPDGLDLDHKCFVRFCCNPEHLKPETRAVNLRNRFNRDAGAAFQRNKTHCKQGHPYSGDNLRVGPSGRRICRTCESASVARYRAALPKKERQRRTHCRKGHEFTSGNTRMVARGSGFVQTCITCDAERVAAYRAKRDKVVVHRSDSCKYGHPFDDENTVVSDGQRSCRTCNREKMRRHRGSVTEPKPLSDLTLKYKTTCRNGHEWTEENTITTGLRRQCRACREAKRS